MTGGLSKSALFNQGKFAIHYPQPCILYSVHANACGIPVLIPDTENGVLLGAAMSAASASGIYSSLSEAQSKMSPKYEKIDPNNGLMNYYNDKFNFFVSKLKQSF